MLFPYKFLLSFLLDILKQIPVLLINLLDLLNLNVPNFIPFHKLLNFLLVHTRIVVDSNGRSNGPFQLAKLQPFGQSQYFVNFGHEVEVGVTVAEVVGDGVDDLPVVGGRDGDGYRRGGGAVVVGLGETAHQLEGGLRGCDLLGDLEGLGVVCGFDWVEVEVCQALVQLKLLLVRLAFVQGYQDRLGLLLELGFHTLMSFLNRTI